MQWDTPFFDYPVYVLSGSSSDNGASYNHLSEKKYFKHNFDQDASITLQFMYDIIFGFALLPCIPNPGFPFR